MKNEDLTGLDESKEFFYIAISILELDSKTNLVPELLQILTPHQLVVLSQIFGGKVVKFPKTQELSLALKTSLYLYYTDVKRYSITKAKDMMEIAPEEFVIIMDKAEEWKEKIKSELGNDYYSSIAD
jgi:hypothetical protein